MRARWIRAVGGAMAILFVNGLALAADQAAPGPSLRLSSARATGDGKTDDRAYLQAAIDAPLFRATLTLDPGKNYLLSAGLQISKPLTLDLNGSTLSLMHATGFPTNSIVLINSRLGNAQTFFQAINAGETRLTVATPPARLPVGSTIFLKLGRHPLDPNEPDYSGFATVTANDGQSLRIDTVLPASINGTSHLLYVPSSVAEDVTITNGKLASQTKDGGHMASVWAQMMRRLTLSKLEIDGPGLVVNDIVGVNVHDLVIRNRFHNENGLGGWHIQDAVFDTIEWHPAKATPRLQGTPQFVSLEHQSTTVRVENAHIVADIEFVLASMQTDSRVSMGKVTITGGPAYLMPVGGVAIDELYLDADDVSMFDFSRVRSLVYKGKRLGAPKSYEVTIPVDALAKGKVFPLPTGVYRKVWMRVAGKMMGDLIMDDGPKDGGGGGHAYNVLQDIKSEEWTVIEHAGISGPAWGTGNINSLQNLQRRLIGHVTGGKQVDLRIEYFPPS